MAAGSQREQPGAKHYQSLTSSVSYLAASLAGIRYALLALLLVPFAVACGGGSSSKTSTGSTTSAGSSGTAINKETHFLMTGPKGLSEVQAGKEKVVIHFDDGSFVLDPAISTDGKRIAFAVQHPATADKNGKVDFGSDLFIANRDGSDMKELIYHSAPGEFISRPNWLQDNRQLLFDVRGTKPNNDPDLRIESLDIDTGARQRLIENGVEPAIAPDGKTVAYVYIDPATQHEQILSADVTTGQSKALTGPGATQVYNIELTWSPDGETLAFAAADPSVLAPGGASLGPTFVSLATGPRQIPSAKVAMMHPFLQDVWVVKKDGTGLKRIADIGESQPSLAWSNDSAYVYAMGTTNFWRIKADGSSKEIIGQGQPSGQVRVLK